MCCASHKCWRDVHKSHSAHFSCALDFPSLRCSSFIAFFLLLLRKPIVFVCTPPVTMMSKKPFHLPLLLVSFFFSQTPMQFVRRTFANREAMQPLLRADILRSELSPAEAEVFNMPLEQWRTTDRRQLAGFHQCDPEPVDPMSCSSVDPSHPLLRKLALVSGPVTKFAADAIVNAANEVALGGHGVDGAIHKGAGPLLRRECATLPCCPCGECIITKGYNLPALYVLHTVGPMGEYPAYLESAYRSVFALSKANKLRTLGMCWVSTGIYGYPLEPAVRIAINETMSFLQENGDNIDRICFACFKHDERVAAEKAIHEWRHSPAAMAASQNSDKGSPGSR